MVNAKLYMGLGLGIALAGFLSAPLAQAADMEVEMVDKACWIEIFEDDEWDADDPHVKIAGPAEFSTMENVKGKDWSNDIESVIVGSNASVLAYSDRDFRGTELAFVPNQRVKDLSDLNMNNDIESMKIKCGD